MSEIWLSGKIKREKNFFFLKMVTSPGRSDLRKQSNARLSTPLAECPGKMMKEKRI
jgi:hypothetical protein